MDPVKLGRILLVSAAILALVGGFLVLFSPSWIFKLGKLPGDIHIQTENTSIFIPITTMLIFSVILSLGWFVVGMLLKK